MLSGYILVSATCSLHLTVTSVVGTCTMRLMKESVEFTLSACAA